MNQLDKHGLLYSDEDRKKIYEVAEKYPWFQIASDGVVEIFCDHHMLSTLRTCEMKFKEEILLHGEPRQRAWSLSFGSFFHTAMEWFDEAEAKGFDGNWNQPPKFSYDFLLRNGQIETVELVKSEYAGTDWMYYYGIDHISWILQCKQYWEENKLNDHHDEPGFKELEGWPGAQLLLLQYWNRYGSAKERLRTVGTELVFGKDREVPILLDPTLYKWAPFRCYLTGRIDRVVDNGKVIGSLDRKTHRYFKKTELTGSKYKPHDAFLGYAYALDYILAEKFKSGRKCNSVIVDMIALKEPTGKTFIKDRFIRVVKEWTDDQKAEFVKRQIATFSQVYQLLVWGRDPQWNTVSCHNQYFKDCPWKSYHEVDESIRPSIFNTFYQIRTKPWSPYEKPELVETSVIAED